EREGPWAEPGVELEGLLTGLHQPRGSPAGRPSLLSPRGSQPRPPGGSRERTQPLRGPWLGGGAPAALFCGTRRRGTGNLCHLGQKCCRSHPEDQVSEVTAPGQRPPLHMGWVHRPSCPLPPAWEHRASESWYLWASAQLPGDEGNMWGAESLSQRCPAWPLLLR
ncbi:hypothetical protein H1C71_037629, partial [Ictidomys tridecemlineatus]